MTAVTPRPALSALLGVGETATGSQPSSWRERLIAQAAELTRAGGWQAITMAKLADRVGVSRQTVYNEIGSKPLLAEAMILTELARFLEVVGAAFDAEPTDVVAAVRRACRDVLVTAQGNSLLHAVVSASHGADTDLLPLLTTHAESLLAAAKAVIRERVVAYDIGLAGAHLDAAIDMVVRVVLSHVMQPSASPAATADDIAWISARVLRP